ncbi:hypothetical protein FQN54_002909 [Arachnomyces sp. PD_36]|nr:hypothetical protein FQN54_002909 [Arachnomyces sp. PD_36]
MAQHALFDNTRTQNQWVVDARFLREIIEHFAPAAEQLDISGDNGKAVFTSFTSRISHGNEILKQPVHTSVAIDAKDFEDFIVEDKLHVVITVKDFKAIVMHAGSLQAKVTARYSRPCYPLQLAYEVEGIVCEFTLMTRGEAGEREDSAMPSQANTAAQSARPSASATSTARNVESARPGDMGPPQNIPRPRTVRPLLHGSARQDDNNYETPRPSASIDPDSLFVPADDDQQWDEQNYGDEDEDMLGWDASVDQDVFNESFSRRIQDNEPPTAVSMAGNRPENGQEAIPPTQRISQIRGLFD